jgi:trans-aconitate methyltransferase
VKEAFMSDVGKKAHWENVYSTKGERDVSWYQESPAPSLELIALAGLSAGASIIDIGGGASRLVDALVDQNVGQITVLDLSAAALDAARQRLGGKGKGVEWVVADVTKCEPSKTYDLWHDRAAFHFLTEARDRAAYLSALRKALKPGGHAIIATFAPDGPERCSGLPVVRYDAAGLAQVLGDGFALVETRNHQHTTPWQSVQQFQFSLFRRV